MKLNNRDTGENHAPKIRTAWFRFYEELNEHLPEKKRKQLFPYHFRGKPSVKNVIGSFRVPHSEVDLILVDGNPVGFGYHLQGGETVSVYPVFESLDISPVMRLRSEPLRKTRFVVDVNLGKLAQKLRLLGFDTLFRNDYDDDEIIDISEQEKRIILTRDKGILTQNRVTHGYWLRNDDPKKQLKEVVQRLQLNTKFKPFSRCAVCNSSLRRAAENEVENMLPEDTISFHKEFWKCSGCGKLYWKGSHYKHIERWVKELKEENSK